MKKISMAELEVLQVIWDKKETTSIEIIEELSHKNWNVNTTRTLIKRLLEKGVIEIVGKNGKEYTYKALIEENEFVGMAFSYFLRKIARIY